MPFKISTLDIRQKLGDLLNRVALRQDEFIIERKGKPLAALVPIDKMIQIQVAARLHLVSILKDQKKNKISQSVVDQLADAAKHASRKKR